MSSSVGMMIPKEKLKNVPKHHQPNTKPIPQLKPLFLWSSQTCSTGTSRPPRGRARSRGLGFVRPIFQAMFERYVGVSIVMGDPHVMVGLERKIPIQNRWFGGTPISENPHILWHYDATWMDICGMSISDHFKHIQWILPSELPSQW